MASRLDNLLDDLGNDPPKLRLTQTDIYLLCLRQVIINQDQLLLKAGNFAKQYDNKKLLQRIEHFLEYKD